MYIAARTTPAAFEFEVDGVTYSATALQSIPMDKAREFVSEAAKGDDMGFAVWVIENLFPEESREAVYSLGIGDAAALVKAYMSNSQASAGE